MQIIAVTTKERVGLRAEQVSLRLDGQHILVVDPATWTFLVTLFVGEFAKGLGEGLGESIGNGILKAMGLLKDDYSDLKEYLDALAEKIINAVLSIIIANELRREHANLDSALEGFGLYLMSPKNRREDLASSDTEARRIFRQLNSLGLAALPGLATAGGLRMAIAAERYR